jgi:hypothetical protein
VFVENTNKCPLASAVSARIRSLVRQDDGRRATQRNNSMGGQGRADTAPVQAKDPKRAENKGDSEQCHSRQVECELRAVHYSGPPIRSISQSDPGGPRRLWLTT